MTLPLTAKTWVRFRSPANQHDGPYAQSGGGKHARLVYHPATHALMLFVGEYRYDQLPDFSKAAAEALAGVTGLIQQGAGTTHQQFSGGSQTNWTLNLDDADAAATVWKYLNGYGQAVGQSMPSRPDNCAITVDTARNEVVLIPGAMLNNPPYTGNPNASQCVMADGLTPYVTEYQDAAVYSLDNALHGDKLHVWTQAPWNPPHGVIPGQPNFVAYGADEGMTYGVYDPVSDAHIYLGRFSGRPVSLHLLRAGGPFHRPTTTWSEVDQSPHLPANGSNKTNKNQAAIDVQGRMVYVVSRDYETSGYVEYWPNGNQKYWLLRYSIEQQQYVGAFLLTDAYTGPGVGFIEQWMVFDSINRKIILPDLATNNVGYSIDNATGLRNEPYKIDPDYGNFPGAQYDMAMLKHLLVFDVDRQTWEDVPVPQPPTSAEVRAAGLQFPFGVDEAHPYITANVMAFDPAHNCMVLMGSDAGLNTNNPTGNSGYHWCFRYDDAYPAAWNAPPVDSDFLALSDQLGDATWTIAPWHPRQTHGPQIADGFPDQALAPHGDQRGRMETTPYPANRTFSSTKGSTAGLLLAGPSGAHSSHPGNDLDLLFYDSAQYVDSAFCESPQISDGTNVYSGGPTLFRTPSGRPYSFHSNDMIAWVPTKQKWYVLPGGGTDGLHGATYTIDPVTRDFALVPGTDNSSPVANVSAGALMYHPVLDALFAHISDPVASQRGIYVLPLATNGPWQLLAPGGDPAKAMPAPPSDFAGSTEQWFNGRQPAPVWNPDRQEFLIWWHSDVFAAELYVWKPTSLTPDASAWRRLENPTFTAHEMGSDNGCFANFTYETRHKIYLFLRVPRLGSNQSPPGPDIPLHIWTMDGVQPASVANLVQIAFHGQAPLPTDDGGSGGGERVRFHYVEKRAICIYNRTVGQTWPDQLSGYGTLGGPTRDYLFRYKASGGVLPPLTPPEVIMAPVTVNWKTQDEPIANAAGYTQFRVKLEGQADAVKTLKDRSHTFLSVPAGTYAGSIQIEMPDGTAMQPITFTVTVPADQTAPVPVSVSVSLG